MDCSLTWDYQSAGSPFPAAYRTAIVHALTAWQAAGYRFTRASDGADITIRFTPIDAGAAWADPATGVLLIDPDNAYRYGFQRRALMAHEIGHLLGLPHNGRVGSVMNPTAMGQAPDDKDITAARANCQTTGETRWPTTSR